MGTCFSYAFHGIFPETGESECSMYQIQIKRIYTEKSDTDGFRILTDRLWPRGIAKEKAAIDFWAKELSPSTYLRKCFDHKGELFTRFRELYREELEKNPEKDSFIRLVKEELKKEAVTLLFASKEEKLNQATVLSEWLKEQLSENIKEHSA